MLKVWYDIDFLIMELKSDKIKQSETKPNTFLNKAVIQRKREARHEYIQN